MAELNLEISGPGQVLLSGDISHESVISVLETNIISSNSVVFVDFSGVNRSDSSGLALMTHWARQAKNANIEINYEHVPVKLAALAKISGLDSILSISAKED
jgi:ABC-type transporter Mla MlaB component